MKSPKKILTLLVCMGMLFAILTGCSQPGQSETAVPAFDTSVYDEVLASVKEVLTLPEDAEVSNGMEGIHEFGTVYGEEALDLMCYTYQDLNQDGTPELLIGVSISQAESFVQNQIYLAYTLMNGEPTEILNGSYRSSYSLLTNGNIAYFASEGAAYSIFGEYQLSEANKLSCVSYYFTHEVDGDFSNIGVFRNATGDFDVELSEQLPVSVDEFWELAGELGMRAIPLTDITPFREFS